MAEFRTRRADGTLQMRASETHWLKTGYDGGYRMADAAYNVTVPDGFDRTDLTAYGRERRERAGFETTGPVLLTGVDQIHARGARTGSVVAVATAGISNPAALPMGDGGSASPDEPGDSDRPPGTVNLLVGVDRALDEGALAALLGVVVEAKTATLLARTGFPGTTTDAAVVGSDPDAEPAAFAGSGTTVGDAARACVREAVSASLGSRYADTDLPASAADAEHGVATTRRASVFDP